MFVTWNGTILGSLDTHSDSGNADPLVLLMQQSPFVGLLIQVRSEGRHLAMSYAALSPCLTPSLWH